MKRNKAILSIFLILVVLLVGVAMIFISSKVSEEQAIAPTAPTSEPRAAETVWVGSEACTVTATSVCVASEGGAEFSDNFETAQFNATKWYFNQSSGRTVAQSSGKLRFTATDATTTTNGASIRSKTFLSEDFDASVDIDSFTATSVLGKHGSVNLKILDSSGKSQAGVALVRQDGNLLFTYLYVQDKDGVQTGTAKHTMTSATTKLYLERRSNEMEAFVIDDGQKVSLGKKTIDFSGPAWVEIINWSNEGVVMAAVLDNLVVNSGGVTCTPDCPTECGKIASTISSCTNSCGVATTKVCPATLACVADLEVTKKAYKYVGGTYAYTTEIDTVAKNQTFIYAITIENLGEIDATNVNITDTLNGEKQDQLTFVDAKSGCTYSASERKVTCSGVTVKAGEENVYAFKVKVANEAVNGDIIKNVAVVNAVGVDISATNELTISTVVGCNHTCTGDSECASGLVCDTSSNKCRREACTEEDTCSCPVITVAPTARPIVIRTPAPTGVVVPAVPPSTEVVEVVQPTVLPEAGILDFPGVAAFGGGLLLAIVGILLAL